MALRPYAPHDFALLERLLGDPEMTTHLGGPESPEALNIRHARYLACTDESEGLFTVVVGRDRTSAGWVGYWRASWKGEDVWECGWHVLPEFQHAGVASAAATLAFDHACARNRYRFMHALPSVENAQSNALCRRLGFRMLGEVDVEYPKGSVMRSNDWCLDLSGEQFDDLEVFMTEKTVAEKARVKPATTIAVLNPVPGVVESLGLPADVSFVEPAEAQLVFLFVNTCAELEAQMPPAVAALAPKAAIWVFYRKGSKSAGLDMSRDSIWALAEKLELRPLGLVGIDDTWSAFRLRPAK